MKVLIVQVWPYPGPSAMSDRVQKLALALKAAGDELLVLGRRPDDDATTSGGDSGPGVDGCGIRFENFDLPPRRRWMGVYIHESLAARKALEHAVGDLLLRFEPDAVVFYALSGWAFGSAARACRDAGVSVAFACDEWFAASRRLVLNGVAIDQWLARPRLLRPPCGLVGISRFWAEYAASRGMPHVIIPALGDGGEMPSPIRATSGVAATTAGPRPFDLLYVGPLSPRDLPMTMLEGVRLAAVAGVDAHLTCVGKWDDWPSGRRACRLAERDELLRPRVTFAGWVSREELERRAATCDAFVLLRDDDRQMRACFPTRLPSLLAGGRPAIMSGAGDLTHYFRHKESAWLLPPGDRPSELAEAVSALAADRAMADRIGAAGCAVAAEAFDYRRYATPLAAFLRGLKSAAKRESSVR